MAFDFAGIKIGGGRPGAVAAAFTVSREAARKWLTGEAMPDGWRILDMADALGVRTEWLLSGKGLMADDKSLDADEQLNRLIALYGTMDDDQRKALLCAGQTIKAGGDNPGSAKPIDPPHPRPKASNNHSEK